MNNQRRNTRMGCHVPVDGKANTPFAATETVDISQGGIGLISHYKIPVDKEIAVAIEISPDEPPILVVGKVKWVRQIKDTSSYRVGLYFKDVLNGSKTRLKKHLAK